MSDIQSNTQGSGDIVRAAGADLTGKEGYLAKLNSSGAAILTAADTDCPQFVIIEGAASGSNVTLRPLATGVQFRVIAGGTIAAGAQICPNGSAGTVKTAASGDFAFAISEETVATESGGHLLARFSPVGLLS